MRTRKPMWIVLLLAMISLAAVGLGFRKTLRDPRSVAVLAPRAWVQGGVPTVEAKPQVLRAYSKLPLHFEANLGQTDARVKFFLRGAGYTLFLTPTESVMVLSPPPAPSNQIKKLDALRGGGGPDEAQTPGAAVLRMKLTGANPNPQVIGLDALPHKSNYFLGRNPKKWRTHVPHYARVEYRDVYPGVDLVYYGNQEGRLEHDFAVAPGADPGAILLSFSGADGLEVDAQGDLLLHTPGVSLRQQKPVVYQDVDGVRRAISGGYRLKGGSRVGFQLGAYDAARALVIDPGLVYSTYLGGAAEDRGFAIAVDAGGNAYLTGRTNSLDFPTANALRPNYGGGPFDAFVTKLNADGSALVYSTYLGGSGIDQGIGIAVDADGNAYVTGNTNSPDFPTMNALQPNYGGGPRDGFVTKLNADASALVYSTYLGGGDFDAGFAIAVDAGGNAYVTGPTASTNFPTANALQPKYGGAPFDAFVTELNADGSAPAYSTYLGASGDDEGASVAADAGGNAYITGATSSMNFPTANALQPNYGGGPFDAFVAKLNADGSALVYSTYLGGSGDDEGFYLAVDAGGNAYVTGPTSSAADFPLFNALQPTYGGGPFDAFVTVLNADGSGLLFSSYLGGSGVDIDLAIAVDASGNTYVTGHTNSINFPTVNALQPNYGGGPRDAFVLKATPQ